MSQTGGGRGGSSADVPCFAGERGPELGFNFSASKVARGFAQALDIVEGALLGEEDVNNDVDVVEQNPLGLATAFDRGRVEPELFLEAHLNLVGDGYDLKFIGCGGDEEEVGEARIGGVEFEDAGVFAFFVFAGGYSSEELAAGFRSCHC